MYAHARTHIKHMYARTCRTRYHRSTPYVTLHQCHNVLLLNLLWMFDTPGDLSNKMQCLESTFIDKRKGLPNFKNTQPNPSPLVYRKAPEARSPITTLCSA